MTRLRKVPRHFVQGQKLAFPHSTKIMAGPFEERSEAWDAMKRLRPEHPEINLSVLQKLVPIERSHPK